jgi:hypothetical protein
VAKPSPPPAKKPAVKPAAKKPHSKAGKKVPRMSWRKADAQVTGVDRADEKLTPKQAAFVEEYLVDLNATKAAERAGYSVKTAMAIGSENLHKPQIVAAIATRKAERLKSVNIDQGQILAQLINVVASDANDLVEYRRTCCRHCWGIDHGYQRTAGEMEADREEWETDRDKNDSLPPEQRKPFKPFNERGGIGYDKRKAPHDDCAECFGEGVGQVFVKDTRLLSPEARSLYAGVKQTKEGLEVKMHDKQGYMTLLMRHAGMLNDKIKVQGDAENPLQLLMAQLAGTNIKPGAK